MVFESPGKLDSTIGPYACLTPLTPDRNTQNRVRPKTMPDSTKPACSGRWPRISSGLDCTLALRDLDFWKGTSVLGGQVNRPFA